MKKLLLAFGLMIFVFSAFAQDREVEKPMSNKHTLYTYSGVDADSLTKNQDTLDIVIITRLSNSIRSIHIASKFDLLGTADTIVGISILGENFDGDTYATLLASSNSSEIAADNQVEYDNAIYTETIASYTSTTATYNLVVPSIIALTDTTSLAGYPADSIVYNTFTVPVPEQTMTNVAQTITPKSYNYKRIVVRYIYPAAGDYTGSGVNLVELKIKFWLY